MNHVVAIADKSTNLNKVIDQLLNSSRYVDFWMGRDGREEHRECKNVIRVGVRKENELGIEVRLYASIQKQT
jgi:hypothetical protein